MNFVSPTLAGTESPTLNADSQQAHAFERTSRERVSAQSHMTDSEREGAIKRAGAAVEKHMADWERFGDFAARGDADRALRLMKLLIAGRSQAQQARMLAAQAERMAREPGASRA